MESKKVGDKLIITMEHGEIFSIHDILGSLRVGEVEEILRRYDYDDGLPEFFEEREANLDKLYDCLDEFMDQEES